MTATGWFPQATITVNGAAGVVLTSRGRARSVIGFTVRDGRIVSIDGLADPRRVERLDLAAFTD